MSRPVLPKELVKLHADLPRKSMRRLTQKNQMGMKKSKTPRSHCFHILFHCMLERSNCRYSILVLLLHNY
jgi:hypothetical protein